MTRTQPRGMGLAVFGSAVLLLYAAFVDAQDWEYFRNHDRVDALLDDGERVWVHSNGGLSVLDRTSGDVEHSHKLADSLPSSYFYPAVRDSAGEVWFSVAEPSHAPFALARFDGDRWALFDSTTPGLPSGNVSCLSVDHDGRVWLGTDYPAYVVRFDTAGFEAVGLVRAVDIDIDSHDTVWAATERNGIAAYDGAEWTTFDTSNTPIPDPFMGSLVIDDRGRL